MADIFYTATPVAGTGITVTGYTIAVDTTVVATASNTITFTNKTYDTAGTGNIFKINGTQVSAVTGTGSAVLATNPTITGPFLNGINDTNGNTIIGLTATATAATFLNITNNTSGNPVKVAAAGGGTNIALVLSPKGTSKITFTDGTDTTKQIQFDLSGATTGIASIISASSTVARTWTLPDATDTITLNTTTQTLTNKTIAFASNTLTGVQASLSGTFDLANFTDPGNGTASAAVAGTVGTFVFGYITYTPNTATDQTQTFQVETGAGTGVFTTVQVSGIVANVSNVGGATMNGFNFFVPTGRKWKHNVSGTAAVTSLSAIVL